MKDILFKHFKWLNNEDGGERADLSGADLHDIDLRGANLRYANLRNTDLSSANLCGTNLCDTDLRDANLRYADLRYADLCNANLRDADLRGADLCGAKNIDSVTWNIYTSFYPIQCPESGPFIGWKKAHGYIVKLEICEDALRSSATSRKCRCSKAKVLEIQRIDDGPANITEVSSDHDLNFVYRIGETVSVDNFDTNRWNECAPGIHFFITREEAVKY